MFDFGRLPLLINRSFGAVYLEEIRPESKFNKAYYGSSLGAGYFHYLKIY